MNRQLKWLALIAGVIVAAFLGMSLSTYVAENASGGGAALFTLTMIAMVAGIFYWLLSGNKKISMADPAATSAALAMQPVDGKAAIYIMRKGFVGMLQGFNFEIEGVVSGQAKGNQFLCAQVAPGSYRIVAKAKGNGGDTQVALASGEVAVFKVILEPGLIKGSIVFERITDLVSARAELASIKLVNWA
jgi:hypothetical protein